MRRRAWAGFAIALVVLLSRDVRAQKKSVDICVANFEEAQLKEKRGKLVGARDLYAACADPKCPTLVRTDCTAKRDEIDRTIPTMTIVVRDAAGTDIADAKLAIDGEPFTRDRSRAFPVDPGEHVITYTVPGKPPADEKITIYEGEKARLVAITAKAPTTKSPSPQTASATPAATPDTGGRSLVVPLIVAGVGVVFVAAAIGLEITAQSDETAAEGYAAKAEEAGQASDEKSRNEFLASSSSRHDAAKRDQLFAIIAGSAGLVAVGIGVVLYFVQPARKNTAFAPWVTRSAGGAMLGGAF